MSSRVIRAALAVTLLAAAVLAGACGSGGGSKDAGNAITRPAYIAKVDALCKQVTEQSKSINAKIQALINGSGTYSSRVRKGAPLLRQTYEIQQSKLERFKAITPPAKDRSQVAEVIAAAHGALHDLHHVLPFADRGSLPEIIDLATDATGNRAKVDRLGTTYGFRSDCFAVALSLG